MARRSRDAERLGRRPVVWELLIRVGRDQAGPGPLPARDGRGTTRAAGRKLARLVAEQERDPGLVPPQDVTGGSGHDHQGCHYRLAATPGPGPVVRESPARPPGPWYSWTSLDGRHAELTPGANRRHGAECRPAPGKGPPPAHRHRPGQGLRGRARMAGAPEITKLRRFAVSWEAAPSTRPSPGGPPVRALYEEHNRMRPGLAQDLADQAYATSWGRPPWAGGTRSRWPWTERLSRPSSTGPG